MDVKMFNLIQNKWNYVLKSQVCSQWKWSALLWSSNLHKHKVTYSWRMWHTEANTWVKTCYGFMCQRLAACRLSGHIVLNQYVRQTNRAPCPWMHLSIHPISFYYVQWTAVWVQCAALLAGKKRVTLKQHLWKTAAYIITHQSNRFFLLWGSRAQHKVILQPSL